MRRNIAPNLSYKEINELASKVDTLKAQWELEKASITGEASIKDEINQVKNQIAEAERNTDLQTAAELKYGKLLQLEKELNAIQNKESCPRKDHCLLKEEVDEDDIAEVVSKWTGIPVATLQAHMPHRQDQLPYPEGNNLRYND